MSILFSSTLFPASNKVKEDSGLPWGALITPLSPLAEADRRTERKASGVARCSQCFGYVNPYCKFRKHTWSCSLCFTSNVTPAHYEKYFRGDLGTTSATFPELAFNCVEYVVAENDGLRDHLAVGDGVGAQDDADATVLEFPSYVFLVDLSSSQPAYLDLVKSALQAALEGLSEMCWVGLAVFSSRLGLYDLRSHIPHVRFCRLSRDVSLAELAGTLDSALVRLDQYKDNIALAIESLSSHATEGSTEKRGFGGALQALVSYMSSEPVNARLLVFLSGRPNFGVGTLDIRKQPDALEPQTPFYRQQAELAAKAGLGIDLFVISSMSYVDLASLKHLTLLTGGTLMLYDTAEECSLPQDLYRQLSTPHVFRGLLRLRTSSEFRVASMYGHLTPDPKFERLFHLGTCTARKTFVCDLEFTSVTGFGYYADCKPVIQMAFAYTQLEQTSSPGRSSSSSGSSSSSSSSSDGTSGSGDGDSNSRSAWRMVRRLRIHTAQMSVAPNLKMLYLSARPDVLLCMLTQQLIQHTLEKGISAARTSLQDWLVALFASYHRHVTHLGTDKGTLDLEFSEVDRLAFLPRYVFALLKHKLLAKDCNPDQRIFLHTLFSCLPSTELGRCIYPNLQSFSTPDLSSADLLYLESGSLEDGRIFLLDGFVSLIVYYTSRALSEGLPFPPPHLSAVRATVNQLKTKNLLVAPKVQYLQEGEPEARAFHQHLLEDKAVMGFSFADFQSVLALELRTELSESLGTAA